MENITFTANNNKHIAQVIVGHTTYTATLTEYPGTTQVSAMISEQFGQGLALARWGVRYNDLAQAKAGATQAMAHCAR